jgi:signal transduction histidine kinase
VQAVVGGRAIQGLVEAISCAAARTPPASARAWLWPAHGWPRRLVIAMWVVLAGGLTGGAIPQMIVGMGFPRGPAALLGIVQCAPLLVAGRWPLLSWRIMAAALFGGMLTAAPAAQWFWPATSCVAIAIALFQVAACHDRRTAVGSGAVMGLGVIAPAVAFHGTPMWVGVFLLGGVILSLIFGDAVGGRFAAEASLAEQAELRRQDLARQAVLAERARIARELHDVVAHHMSVIAMQSEAAPYKISDLPPAAQETFGVIRRAAREALSETRRVVGLLREEREAAERLPQPGLDRIEELTEGAHQAGLDVKLTVIGMPRPLAAGVDLSAYRIVQEALSNAARYAPGTTVQVDVRYGGERLRLSVRDDGTATDREPVEPAGGGHGLVGMRERVAMLGGRFSAGPHDDGGFAVEAELPYGDLPV